MQAHGWTVRIYVGYLHDMPEDDENRLRSMRIPDKRWAAIERVATQLHMDRTALINGVMAWWMREPNAKRPQRPAEYPDDPQVK